MEDWGYGAGFDTASDAGFYKCTPKTEPKLDDSFFESQENVRCAVYLIEADDSKNPRESTYGSREVADDGQVLRSSIEDREQSHGFDGHMNRNIRLAMTMIDMSKPYVYVQGIEEIENGGKDLHYLVSFTVNGCATINEVSYTLNSHDRQVLAYTGYCNQDINGRKNE